MPSRGAAAEEDPAAHAQPVITTPAATTTTLTISQRLVSSWRIVIIGFTTTTFRTPDRVATQASQPQECERVLRATWKLHVRAATGRAGQRLVRCGTLARRWDRAKRARHGRQEKMTQQAREHDTHGRRARHAGRGASRRRRGLAGEEFGGEFGGGSAV